MNNERKLIVSMILLVLFVFGTKQVAAPLASIPEKQLLSQVVNASGLTTWTFDDGGAPGKIGNAKQFNGMSDFVSVNAADFNFSNNYTISFWVSPTNGFSGTILRISNSTSNTIARSKYEIRVTGTGVTFITGDGTTADSDVFGTTIPIDTWSLITCVHGTDNSKSCYKDGVLISSKTSDVDTSLVTPSVGLIGTNRNLEGNNFYEGNLDDLRVYNRALAADEVQQIFTAAGGTVSAPPPPTTTEPLPTSNPPVTTNGTCTQVSQYGITWIFDKAYTCGTFANGDYWVIGPATVMQITPDFDGSKNGWEVNPASSGITSAMKHGFDSMTGGFDATLVPVLPYVAQPNQSIVKSVHASCAPSCTNSTSVLQTAAVLTVLGNIPPDNGVTVFRPPYVGTSKPLYRTTSLRANLLPSLSSVGSPGTLDGLRSKFIKVQLDHFYAINSSWRNLHPIDNMPDYGGDIGRRNSDMIRLFLNESIDMKMPALVAYVQYGIDLLHMSALGQNWMEGGSGHKPGQLLPIVFAAVMLNDSNLLSIARSVSLEENAVSYKNAAGVALFGQVSGTGPTAERYYWQSVSAQDGFKTRRDPYEKVDGGYLPGTSYQSIITPIFRSEVLAFDLIPELKTVWYKPEFFEYVHRSMDIGSWSQPDPCAPYDGNMLNYGITFGPNGSGGCILDTNPGDGVGRFPNRQGISFYSSAYKNAFQDAMWSAYQVPWQGSYGGTSASVTPPPTIKQGDFNSDGVVNSIDLSLMSSTWNQNNATYDLNKDGTVNTLDYTIMVKNWTI